MTPLANKLGRGAAAGVGFLVKVFEMPAIVGRASGHGVGVRKTAQGCTPFSRWLNLKPPFLSRSRIGRLPQETSEAAHKTNILVLRIGSPSAHRAGVRARAASVR